MFLYSMHREQTDHLKNNDCTVMSTALYICSLLCDTFNGVKFLFSGWDIHVMVLTEMV